MRIAPRRYTDERALAEIEARLEERPEALDLAFERACCLEDLGWTTAAAEGYTAILRRDKRHLGALTNLGSMCLDRSDPERAQRFFTQALTYHPLMLLTHVNLGLALFDQGETPSAIAQYHAALAVDPQFFAAHHALALLYEGAGEGARAEHHWAAAFAKGAIWPARYTGPQPPAVRLLLLVSGRGGGVVLHQFLDDRVQTTMVHADGYRPEMELPEHDVLFNAIGDADRCASSLERARAVFARSNARKINDPARVLATTRVLNALRFGAIPGVVAPRIEQWARADVTAERLLAAGWRFPLLVRAPGFQEGRHFALVSSADELPEVMARINADPLLLIEYLDVREPDGFVRKYRVLFVEGRMYPVHLAASSDWKVHYFSADMAANAAHRDEERAFLSDMPAVLGPRAIAALEAVGRTLDLDYGGVDFALDAAGNVVVFEANATMAVYAPPPGEQWDYRRPARAAIVEAVRSLLAGD